MGILGIKELRPGMVLAADLRDGNNRLLMQKGTPLTEKSLKICRMWGIIEADIEGASPAALPEDLLEREQAAAEAVQQRFCFNDLGHPAIRELVRLCTLRAVAGKAIWPVTGNGPAADRPPEQVKPRPLDPAAFIGEHTHLSMLPGLYQQIIEVISTPNSSTADIENVINKDTHLTARVLYLVNSAFYNLPAKVDTVSRAVNIVGTKQLSTLAFGVNIISFFKDIPAELVNMELFWRHSMLCGACARILAGYKQIQNIERMFLAGLLHDIGRLVLYNHCQAEAAAVIATAHRDGALLYGAEQEAFGLNHAAIGSELLKRWKMPMSLEDMVACHHNPQQAKSPTEAAILHVADLMANAMAEGTSGERWVPPLAAGAWEALSLTPNVLALTLELADRQLEEVFGFLYQGEKGR